MITITETLYKKMPDDIKACFNQLPNPSSEEVRECFPESKGGAFPKTHGSSGFVSPEEKENRVEMNDSGNASRFFKSIIYQAKASKSERNRGCEGLEENIGVGNYMAGAKWINDPRHKDGGYMSAPSKPQTNSHPTVKPIKLMEYLVNLVSKEDHTVLDPFAGSGTTGIACKKLNRNFIGIERDEEYCKIATARINSI